MPSTSPGSAAFAQVLPGSPTPSLQSFATFLFRFARYVAYISGSQLNVLSSPTNLVHTISFDHQLVALAADSKTGKLVVASKSHVWILEPMAEGWKKAWWETTLHLVRPNTEDEALCVDWGNEGEVLVGGSRMLSLFSTLSSSRAASHIVGGDETGEQRAPLWSKAAASPICQAAFSPSSSIIATRAQYDRLVKIWRRLSFEEGLFDHTYLPHAGSVTHFQWRPANVNAEERRGSGVSGRHDDGPEVLYTIATDAVLRVWRTGGSHDLDILILHTTIDLIGAIPNSPTLTVRGPGEVPPKSPRYAVMIPSDDFSAAINTAIGLPREGKVNHSKELLKEMVPHEADVVVTFDGQGRMSAWGLESIGHRRRSETPSPPQAFHIAHSERLQVKIPNCPATCATWFHDDELHFLTQNLTRGGGLTWWKGKVEAFFSSSTPGHDRLSLEGTWSGHDDPVTNIRPLPLSAGLLSWSSNEICTWKYDNAGSLRRESSIRSGAEVLAVTAIPGRDLVLVVNASEFVVWAQDGKFIAKTACDIDRRGNIHVQRSSEDSVEGVFVQNDGRQLIWWEFVRLSSTASSAISINAISTSELDRWADVVFAVPVSSPTGPASTSAVAVGKEGRLFVDRMSSGGSLEHIAMFESGMEEPTSFAATPEFAAIVSSSTSALVIVHLTDGYIEHRQHLQKPTTGLEGFSSGEGHNYLAIGYGSTIDVLVQGRYEHPSSPTPTWMLVKTVSIEGTGLGLSAMTWLRNGDFATAAGNGVFIASSKVNLSELDTEFKEAHALDQTSDKLSLGHVAMRMQTALPAWHPSLLSRLVQHGHFGLAVNLLDKLSQKLKFWGPGEGFDAELDEQLLESLRVNAGQEGELTEDTASQLQEQLLEKQLPELSNSEQRRLSHNIEAIVYLSKHVKALDKHAQRYLFNWKLQLLYAHNEAAHPRTDLSQSNGASESQQFVPSISWREIAFAHHSTTQQALLDILLLHLDNKLTWPTARSLGITAWLSDRTALEQIFEQIAQSAYRSEQPPDPVNASIYFLALHKKATLLALWRIATWHREQKSTMNFLKKDFGQPEARTSAKKNAYALMGKRRFHYSAAFFLLADDPASAVSILAGQCEDPAFAVAVARLYCGDGSPVLRTLLEDRIMPQARTDGNRWLLSWCHEVLLERSKAAESLLMPLEGPRTWQQDDPNVLLLYRVLRKQSSPNEYAAVLRAARILRRMGQWTLALHLVSTWEFQGEVPQHPKVNGAVESTDIETEESGDRIANAQVDPPSLLDSFADAQPQAVTSSAPSDQADRQAKAAELLKKLKAKKEAANEPVNEEKKKPEPTQFTEPSASSLLDSFGF